MGAEFDASNIMELWVKNPNDYEKAVSLIKRKFEGQTNKPSWICSECKEENEGNFNLCWNCQSSPVGV